MKFCTTLGGTQYKCEAWSPHRPVCNCPEKTGRTPHVTEAAAAASHNWCCIRHKAEERERVSSRREREGYIAKRRESYKAKERDGSQGEGEERGLVTLRRGEWRLMAARLALACCCNSTCRPALGRINNDNAT